VFNATFIYIVTVSVIGGGKRPTCRKSLTNFITSCCIEYTSPDHDGPSGLTETDILYILYIFIFKQYNKCTCFCTFISNCKLTPASHFDLHDI
jgi:hypothetical protein